MPWAVVESPEEGGEEGTDGQDGGGEEASEHHPPGPAASPRPAAGAHQERPADRLQPRPPGPSPAPAQPEQAGHPAGRHQRPQADVSSFQIYLCICRFIYRYLSTSLYAVTEMIEMQYIFLYINKLHLNNYCTIDRKTQ